MVTWRLWAGAAALLVTMSVNAADTTPADQPVDTAQAMLDRMDRNVDGKISHEEYRNAMIRRFGARDRNDDGVLEGEEFPKEWVAGAEVQGATGKVTSDQFAAELPRVFLRFDVDGDGQLDTAEIAALAVARQTQEESR